MAFVSAPFTLNRACTNRVHRNRCNVRAISRIDEDMSSAKAVGDRLLIRVSEASSETSGGLLLTPDSSKRPRMGVVVSIPASPPPAAKDVIGFFKVGDNVMWPNDYVAETIQDGGECLVSVKARHISGKW